MERSYTCKLQYFYGSLTQHKLSKTTINIQNQSAKITNSIYSLITSIHYLPQPRNPHTTTSLIPQEHKHTTILNMSAKTMTRTMSNNTNQKEPCGQSQEHLNNNDTKQTLAWHCETRRAVLTACGVLEVVVKQTLCTQHKLKLEPKLTKYINLPFWPHYHKSLNSPLGDCLFFDTLWMGVYKLLDTFCIVDTPFLHDIEKQSNFKLIQGAYPRDRLSTICNCIIWAYLKGTIQGFMVYMSDQESIFLCHLVSTQ